MASYYTGSDNQRDTAPMIYLRESMPGSFLEGPVLPGNTMLYMSSGSYSDAFAGNSQQQNNCVEIPTVEAATSQQQEILSNLGGLREQDFSGWRDGRNEVLAMHLMGGTSGIVRDGQNLHGQGLSLSLGTQIPYRNPGSGFPSGNQESNKGELSAFGMSSMATTTIPNSKYLKAAQQLLDEVVNVQKALKQPDGGKNGNSQENRVKSSKEDDGGSKNVPANQQESSSSPIELSYAERQELQSKLTKLLFMLDEVDRRYKQYYHQMQIVVSSFDAIAGCGASKPYTALALQTISRHFRYLRDAINGQIQATRTSLGEPDAPENSKELRITRLRYVDQQLRQQRALQQFGMTQQHAWRPQRGLPESSVSILRAWLFEHFLHPYPKDSDKIMLARQTGLTRSQVSNWFINARVRLWKPMVEEMYKEEFADAEMDSNSSSDNAVKAATKGDTMTSEERGEDLQQSGTSSAMERCSNGQLMDSKSENVHDADTSGSTIGARFLNASCGEAETEYMLQKLREEQRLTMDDSNIFPDASVHLDGGSHRFMAAAGYNVSELGRYGSGVSLTLGLQHYEDGSISMSGGSHHQNFVAMRGDDMYNHIPTETGEFECMNPSNRQDRLSSSQLLHDFVA